MERIPESEWVWQGHPGHFIAVHRCDFRLSTVVGDVLISTIGDYFPDGRDKPKGTLGCGDKDFFETMTFVAFKKKESGCGCRNIQVRKQLDCRRYATGLEAREGHMELCRKYAENQP